MRHIKSFDGSLLEGDRLLPSGQRDFKWLSGIPGWINLLQRKGVPDEYWVIDMTALKDNSQEAWQDYFDFDSSADDYESVVWEDPDAEAIETMATDIYRGQGPLGKELNRQDHVWTDGDIDSFVGAWETGQGVLMRLKGPEEGEYVIDELMKWMPDKTWHGRERRDHYKAILRDLSRIFPAT